MREAGGERAERAQPVRASHLLARPAQIVDEEGVLDRDHRLRGDPVEQRVVGGAEAGAAAAVVHDQRAHHARVADQRHEHHFVGGNLGGDAAERGFEREQFAHANELDASFPQLPDELGCRLRRDVVLRGMTRDRGVARRAAHQLQALATRVEEEHARAVVAQFGGERGEQQVEQRHQLEFAVQQLRRAVQDLQLAKQMLAFAIERVVLDRIADREPHLVGRPRLRQIAVDPTVVDRFAERRGVTVRGHEDADGLRVDLAHLGEQLDAAHAVHAVVGEHHGGRVLVQDLERLLAASRDADLVVAAEGQLEDPGVLDLVVDEEDRILAVVEQALDPRSDPLRHSSSPSAGEA